MKKEYSAEFYFNRSAITRRSAEEIVKILDATIQTRTVIDFGCATGIWLDQFKKLGSTEVLGIDGDWVDRKSLSIDGSEYQVHDFGKEKFQPPKTFDLALCIEVAEHISEKMGVMLIDSLVEASDVILFSAAVEGQGGSGHVNEQSQSYWLALFADRGYQAIDLIRPSVWGNEKVNTIYKQNMLLYVKEVVVKKSDTLGAITVSKPYEADRIHPDLLKIKASYIENRLHSSFLFRLKSKILRFYARERN
jgi:SAM-dependent methyltransferase